MNLTEVVYLTSEIFIHRLFRETVLLHFIQDSFAWVSRQCWNLSFLLVSNILVILIDLSQLLWFLLCIFMLTILFSLYDSLKPRYNFLRDKEKSENLKNELNQEKEHLETRIFVNTLKSIIFRETPSTHTVIFQRFLNKIKEESAKLDDETRLALKNSDIQTVYRELPWSFTQFDLEGVQWLNQALLTSWPSLKTLLNKFILDDLLKPKSKDYILSKETKGLTKKEAKLSVLISCRRKLDNLRKERSSLIVKYQDLINKSSIAIIVTFIKLGLIYIKQFVIDYVKYMINLSTVKKEKRNLDLKEFLLAKLNSNSKFRRTNTSAKSWSGFDIHSERREKSVVSTRNKRKFRSAEVKVDRVFFDSNGLKGPRSLARLRKKRFKSANDWRKAKNGCENKDITFEQIKLGNCIPTIDGIKYIEEHNDLLREVETVSTHLVPSDDCNMRFIIELSYTSDNKFCILVNSIPILNRICLSKISAKVRLLITLNHTVSELNRDLKIFQTPDDILWPIINHAQIALVDVPLLDWELERPRLARVKNNQTRSGNVKASKSQLKYKIKQYLDPVHIINHTYFKYITHSVIYLALKWFQPFDVKIGDHLYIKSIC